MFVFFVVFCGNIFSKSFFMKRFRPTCVYEEDFPVETVQPQYEGKLQPYNINEFVRRVLNKKKTGGERYAVSFLDLAGFKPQVGIDDGKEEIGLVDNAIRHRGEEYYYQATQHERFILSVVPNLRDLEIFSDIHGFRTGQVFRSGYPLSHDPEKLLHVLKNVLQVRSIFDLRGFLALDPESGDPSESTSRHALFSLYTPFVYVPSVESWACLRSIQSSQTAARHQRCKTNSQTFDEGDDNNINDYSIYIFNISRPVDHILKHRTSYFSTVDSEFIVSSNTIDAASQRLIRLLIAGASLFSVLLRGLLHVRLPLLMYSSDTADEIALTSMLVLAILGATDEAIITDFCSTEAGVLMQLNIYNRVPNLQERNLYNAGHYSSRATMCQPDVVRQTLKFIRHRYGSIDGYLNAIGFHYDSRERLRCRFLLHSKYNSQSKILYHLPSSYPFWTRNPGVYVPGDIPNKSAISTPEKSSFFTVRSKINSRLSTNKDQLKKEVLEPIQLKIASSSSSSSDLQRVLRIISLLQLHDSFMMETFVTKHKRNKMVIQANKAHHVTCKSILLKKLKKLQFKKKQFIFSHAKHRLHILNYNSRQEADQIALKRHQQLQLKETDLKWRFHELLFAQKTVLAKLRHELQTLQQTDIPQLLQYRTTQIYALRNRHMGITTSRISLVNLYLSEPEMFYGANIKTTRDVVKALMRRLQECVHRHPSLMPCLFPLLKNQDYYSTMSLSLKHDIAENRYAGLIAEDCANTFLSSKSKEIKQKKIEANGNVFHHYIYEKPIFFYHELYNPEKKQMVEQRIKVLPNSFAEWLMYHWMVSLDDKKIHNPFIRRFDECLLSPQTLAVYTRFIIKKNQNNIAIINNNYSKNNSTNEIKEQRSPLSLETLIQHLEGHVLQKSTEQEQKREYGYTPKNDEAPSDTSLITVKFYDCLKNYVSSVANLIDEFNKESFKQKKETSELEQQSLLYPTNPLNATPINVYENCTIDRDDTTDNKESMSTAAHGIYERFSPYVTFLHNDLINDSKVRVPNKRVFDLFNEKERIEKSRNHFQLQEALSRIQQTCDKLYQQFFPVSKKNYCEDTHDALPMSSSSFLTYKSKRQPIDGNSLVHVKEDDFYENETSSEFDTDEEYDWVSNQILQDEIGTWYNEAQEVINRELISMGASKGYFNDHSNEHLNTNKENSESNYVNYEEERILQF